MKKILITLLSAIAGFGAMAQDVEPNRLLIYDKNQSVKGFVLDNVDYMEFQTVDGEVAADIEILDVTLEKQIVKITRTPSCQSYRIACVPTVQIANAGDASLASLIERQAPNAYYQDFTAAEMTGTDMEPSTEYSILTLGYDIYGVGCEIRRADFTTPSIPVVGTPTVTVETVDVQKYEFTLKFTPNADVSRYAVVSGAKGEMQKQYEMFAPMFGYKNFGQMIDAWGVKYEEAAQYTWTQMQPGTDYEVFVQTWDVNGTMAEYTVYEVSTVALGGEGVAAVTITLDRYELADWNGEMLPSQFITFTPNDQSSAYRFGVYTAEGYDSVAEEIKTDLCSEPPMPVTGWFFYEPFTTDFQINPNTECVAIAAAKNANGEWGSVTELRFTTPAEVSGSETTQSVQPSAIIKKRKYDNAAKQAGVIPAIKINSVQLIGK